MAWPKTIEIGNIKVSVDSWEEIRDAIAVFGSDGFTVSNQSGEKPNGLSGGGGSGANSSLSPADRTLLQQFVETNGRGVLIATVGEALGAHGKGIRPELERWSRRIGLVISENATAFDKHKRYDGWAYRMTDHYIRTANQILGR
jgi:hypothetical protein